MSRIDDLIRELCPEGVEMKSISELTRSHTPPKKIPRSEFSIGGDIPIIDQSKDAIAGYTSDVSALVDLGPTVIFGDHTRAVKFFDKPFAAGADGTVILEATEIVATKYLFYAFSRLRIPSRGYNRHWSVVRLMLIPVPPLPVQEEIVRILDTFTELEAELVAELEARTAQYEETRNRLMAFDAVGGHPLSGLIRELCPDGIPGFALGQVARYSPTRVECSELDANSFVGVDNLVAGKRGRVDSAHIPGSGRATAYSAGDILLGNIRPYLKKIWLATNDGGCSGDVLAIRIKQENRETLEPKFLYYVLSSDHFFEYDVQWSKGAKMPRGDKASILKYQFLVPPLAIQRAVVEILDSFDALVNDFSVGLPAEIAARRKQYEYYRDKMLTFEALAA